MLEEGFETELPPPVVQELSRLESSAPIPAPAPSVRDLRELPWSSIDNDDSRDLDQVEAAETLPDGDIRVWVGIADVDAIAPRGSAIDLYAGRNTTSVYTGAAIFPMLPDELSGGLTSLLQNGERMAVVVEMVVTREGDVHSPGLYRAILRNHARLTYHAVGDWLEGVGPIPAGVADIQGMEDQIRLQDRAAQWLMAHRQQCGALDFETIEPVPVMESGRVVGLTVPQKNRARYIIENLMIAANTTIAGILQAQGVATIQRVVREPERWSRIVELARNLGYHLPNEPDARPLSVFLAHRRTADPLRFPDLSLSVVKLLGPGEYTVVGPQDEGAGHFGLAVQSYTHSTAPNRRYPDLVTQRLIKAVDSGMPVPYDASDLEGIARHCSERESAARKVERLMRKVTAAVLFHDRVGQVFDAIVTGVARKGVFIRTLDPPLEGRVIRGEEGMDVGDRVRVCLLDTDPERGYIDFEREV
jgi:exoribonuclease-2